jgi:outer membrane protein OmpA-like peptidoglycan-associated protein/Mg-chelatase subunit ChlD
MRNKLIFILLAGLLFAGRAFAAGEPGVQLVTTAPGGIVTVERVINDGKVLLSVSDTARNPMLGLTIGDFAVTMGERPGKITSVKLLEESQEVPRNMVLVLDNSSSMQQRNAVEPLKAGVNELLKTIRPIDKVQIVVFGDKGTTNLRGRDLRVQTFTSNQRVELQKFVAEAYGAGITIRTMLYDAMLVGLERISMMPSDEPRFMVVFSDGEDLNSSYSRDDVLKAMEATVVFNAYAVDYMPDTDKDKLLTAFAERNHGQIWKATSETNLVPIFQSVASKMQYYYVVSYLFPTTGSLTVAPASLTIDEVENFDASATSVTSVRGAGSAGVVRRIDTSELTLRAVMDTVYGIAHWNVTVSNAGGTIAVQTGEGAPAAEIKVPIKTADLGGLIAGGDLRVTMEVQDRKGQNIVLTALPVKVNRVRTTGSLTVVPASLTIDEVENFDASVTSVRGAVSTDVVRLLETSELTLRPVVDTVYGIAHWNVTVSNTGGTIAVQTGEGAPAAEIKVPIKTADLGGLIAGGDLRVTMEVQDRKGQNIVLTALPVKVNRVRTTGSLTVVPASLTIEEIRTIDASPMLGHIYFPEGSGEIPAQYVRLAGIAETAAFDEQRFRDTLEKYYQVLNIVGKRLAARPEATITIVGCNSDTGLEKNKKQLSAKRAQAVRDYLQMVWNIAPERMPMEARNLPVKPSTRNLKEGQAENRRVEIHSTDLEVLAPIRSVYLTSRIDTPLLKLHQQVVSPHGIANWNITVSNAAGNLVSLHGKGSPAAETVMPMNTGKLEALGTGGDIAVKMELQDIKGQIMTLSPAPIKVNFLQTSQRLAQKQDLRVQEKYALILFDFDKDTIEAGNQEIVNRIVARIRELPQAAVDIVGYTDNIGKEEYNIKLSERRALAVYKLLIAAYGESPGQSIRHRGVGPRAPLYDNLSPEARSFNRTVTITLEYMANN